MRTVPLHGDLAQGRAALVDDEDYDLVARYRWRVWQHMRPCGSLAGPYAMGGPAPRVTLYMHALITAWPRTDHIDHDGLNNQRSNLRPATRAENAWNAKSHGATSQYKGVCWFKQGRKWEAGIRTGGKRRYLGRYQTEIEAALAYDAAARELFGEYAFLNFP